jgi:ribosomal protein S18 acetylase RimI-like enzyme
VRSPGSPGAVTGSPGGVTWIAGTGRPATRPAASLRWRDSADNRKVTITYHWRGDFENVALAALHAEGFAGRAGRAGRADWRARVRRHSLGWVCARRDGELVGFVNVAWDGGAHAFILDTAVATGERRRGVGTELITVSARQARAAGCEWLHVDFEDHLAAFYFQACGFTPTAAGLIALPGRGLPGASQGKA